jgi:hypothetical protein
MKKIIVLMLFVLLNIVSIAQGKGKFRGGMEGGYLLKVLLV